MALLTWWADARHRLSQRALHRQLDYQKGLAQRLRGSGDGNATGLDKKAAVHELLTHVELPERPRVLDVGSGAKGLLFNFPRVGLQIAVDPLALDYSFLFPNWLPYVRRFAAFGERLPFRQEVFDVVMCDNVIDHAEDPAEILRELIRVLKPNGTLYFTVNVHHSVYHYAAVAHCLWNALGIRLEIDPFADHTVHLTVDEVRRMLTALPLRVWVERDGITAARRQAQTQTHRSFGILLKRLFFKNARYVVIAAKHGEPTAEEAV